jgi:Ca2+-binding RTX toxin-like protein
LVSDDRVARAGLTSGARLAGRNRIDGLAIGAPVTATFIGVMLAKGELGSAGAGDSEAVAAAHRLAPGEIGATETTAGDRAPIGPGEDLNLEDGAAGPPALDPVSVGALGPEAAKAAAPPASAEMPGLAAAIPSAEAGAAGGGAITVNLSSMGLGLGVGMPLDDLAAGQLAPPLGTSLVGGSGDDILVGTDRRDHLEGGAGDDLIRGLGGDDWLDGGSGDDAVHGDAGDDTLLGGTGDDLLDGGADDDLLLGGDGDDSVLGGSGQDTLDGGAGNDSLNGGSGIDRLSGGAGNDVLGIDNSDDLALERSYGADGGGYDTLRVGEGFGGQTTFVFGDDLAASGEGTSSTRHQVHSEIENLVLMGSAGHDAIGDARDNSLVGNAGSNALYGAAGDDFLQAGAGDDLLDGGLGVDRLEGGAGRDMLNGGLGADDLYGGTGDDRLAGGLEADRLYGEAGDDIYVVGLNDHAVDTIFDHEGSNSLLLEGFTNQTVAATIVDGDLYLGVDDTPVAVVSDYVGHEDSFAGVDLGAGIVAIEDLLAAHAAGVPEPVLPELEPEPQGDLLASYLSRPSLSGADTADQLNGTDGADWLQGLAGNDQLRAGDGADVLEGGVGQDLLQGGAGDDRYLFRAGESGLDTIRDAEGSNIAELHGFTGARLEGVVVGRDLYVVADYAPILKVENYVGNEASFAGVQVDDTIVATDELFN